MGQSGVEYGVIDELARNGLKRGENGLRVIMMCEISFNALLVEQFLPYFVAFPSAQMS